MNGMTTAALIIIFSLVAYFLLFLWMCRQDEKQHQQAEKLQPLAEPETPLARMVWEAHRANQELETAISTGTVEEIDDALIEVVFCSKDLMDHLKVFTEEERAR